MCNGKTTLFHAIWGGEVWGCELGLSEGARRLKRVERAEAFIRLIND